MKRIMLVCGAGLSTSLLVLRMKEAAANEGVEVDIFASPDTKMMDYIQDVDCILLGPMVRYELAAIQQMIKDQQLSAVCGLIDLKDYGMMDGKAIYNYAKTLLEATK